MLTSALCPKCHHQLIEPCPKSSPFYPTAGHPLTQPDHVQPDCNNVVLNVEVSLKIELPKHCLNTLNSNVTVVSKALQCGGGIVLPTSENEDNSTDLDKYLENPSHVRSIESTYPIGFDENRRNFGRGAPEIRLNQSCAVTPNPTLPLNIPMGREICQRDLDTLTATVKVLRMSGECNGQNFYVFIIFKAIYVFESTYGVVFGESWCSEQCKVVNWHTIEEFHRRSVGY